MINQGKFAINVIVVLINRQAFILLAWKQYIPQVYGASVT